MTALAIARFLPDFDAGEPPPPEPEVPVFNRKTYEEERASSLAEAEERGVRNGLAAAREEYEAARLEMQADHERRLRDERARWTTEEGARLSEELRASIDELTCSVASRVAEVLTPVIEHGLAKRAAAQVADATRTLLSRSQNATIRISGESDLVEAIRAGLGEDCHSVEFVAGSEAGVRLTGGDTSIETQLDLWRQRLAAALREGDDE